jgi:hypothetical protein
LHISYYCVESLVVRAPYSGSFKITYVPELTGWNLEIGATC